jgi:excisionase family DNA binding protein
MTDMKAMTANATATGGTKAHTLRQVAERLGVTLPAVYKLIRDKKLVTFHIGTAHRVSVDALRACIKHLEAEELP